jgi:hypothetical protein
LQGLNRILRTMLTLRARVMRGLIVVDSGLIAPDLHVAVTTPTNQGSLGPRPPASAARRSVRDVAIVYQRGVPVVLEKSKIIVLIPRFESPIKKWECKRFIVVFPMPPIHIPFGLHQGMFSRGVQPAE